MKERVENQNELESYANLLKNQVGDKEKLCTKFLKGKRSASWAELRRQLSGWMPAVRLRYAYGCSKGVGTRGALGARAHPLVIKALKVPAYRC